MLVEEKKLKRQIMRILSKEQALCETNLEWRRARAEEILKTIEDLVG